MKKLKKLQRKRNTRILVIINLNINLKKSLKALLKKRINRIVGDALHTNQCNISFATAQEQGYKYKVWNNGRGKGRVRPWHRAKVISAVELDDKFYIYGSYPAYMMYPGDLEGGAENVANCRCWLNYTNITPSNLKTKGTIKIKDNVQLTKPNTVSTNKNTASNNKGLRTKVKESIPTKVKTVIQKVKNKFKKISKKITPKPKLKLTSKFESKLKVNKDNNKLQSIITKNKVRSSLKDVYSKEDIELIVEHIDLFLSDIYDVNYEFGSVRRLNNKIVETFTDWEKSHVNLLNG